MNNFCLSFIFSLTLFCFYGQQGIVRGSVIDNSTGELLPMVKIQVEGMNKGAFSDLDGKFEVKLDPGTYNLIFSMYSYSNTVINAVEVKADDVTLVENVMLSAKVTDLGEVTVQAEYKKNTENAILRLKLKSANMIDGISASNFRKTGDSDAASAMRRVPGISVANGKYIFIRGIGDRYNKTILNGLDIPGLDPDRNTLQMDIFPTSLIDNMIVNKSFSAELPADFTGGLVNIELASFPNKKTQNISFRAGYNPNFHLRNDYLDYKGGNFDFLGFDDGTRAIPAENNIPNFTQVVGNPQGQTAQNYRDILRSFNSTMAAQERMSLVDMGMSMTFGDQIKKEKRTYAYNFMLNYRNNTEFYEEAIFARYGLPGNPDLTAMDTMEYQNGRYGVNTVMLSTLAGFAMKTLKAKYSVTLMHLQNGESSAGIFDFVNNDEGSYFEGYQHNLFYSQKSLSNLHIAAKYKFEEAKWDLEWKISPTYSRIYDPDIRFTRYEVIDDGVRISTETGFPERIWRDLNEINAVSLVSAKKTYEAFGSKAFLKLGAGHTYKQRSFEIKNFAVNVREGNSQINLTGNPNELFEEDNLWPYYGDATTGVTIETPFLPDNPNKFNSNINNTAAYVSNEMTIGKKFKSIIGLRTEYYVHRYTGQNQLGTIIYDNDKVLENLGIFPAVNLVFSVTENQNFRFSYGKTIARPSFKELSFAEIYDPITGRTFIGGLFEDINTVNGEEKVYWDGNLRSTNIHNLDFRWEVFPDRGRTISISGFYKKFFDPIEIIQYATQPGAFQPRNVGDGQVIGGEFEIRENLAWISEKTKAFDFVLNVTIVDSRIQLSETEYDSRVENARTGQTIERYRKMAGQAPYIINGGFSFNGVEKGFFSNMQAGIFYNVQGETLQFAGIIDRPDIYSVPFHSLNFNVNKTFGKDEQYTLGVRVSNCLNDKRESIFKSFNADDQFFTQLSPGVSGRVRFAMNL
ncbi:MAG: TonB-dependent receptor domain-containing protein [Crocinitomicaceae bacterium]